jgi:hypothetical protein
MRVHGMKVICLTTGDLTDVLKHLRYLSEEARLKKIYCEKSAEAIVAEETSHHRKVEDSQTQ